MWKEDISYLSLIQYLLCCVGATFVMCTWVDGAVLIAKLYLFSEERHYTFSKISLENL